MCITKALQTEICVHKSGTANVAFKALNSIRGKLLRYRKPSDGQSSLLRIYLKNFYQIYQLFFNIGRKQILEYDKNLRLIPNWTQFTSEITLTIRIWPSFLKLEGNKTLQTIVFENLPTRQLKTINFGCSMKNS